jgi:hypothetical protein
LTAFRRYLGNGKPPRRAAEGNTAGHQLKIAPIVASDADRLIVQAFGPAAVIVPVLVQLEDHPPKFTPVICGAVMVTVEPIG